MFFSHISEVFAAQLECFFLIFLIRKLLFQANKLSKFETSHQGLCEKLYFVCERMAPGRIDLHAKFGPRKSRDMFPQQILNQCLAGDK